VFTEESLRLLRSLQSGTLGGASDGSERCIDAVVVLGGGLWESKVIPPWAVRRLDGAARLVSACNGAVPVLICGGGSPHGQPVLHPTTGQVIHEGTAYAEYLMDVWGVRPEEILKESSSYDTVGNGYFSAMIHAVPAGWRDIAVVTSDFHMPRSRAIFEKVYGLVNASLGVDVGLRFFAVRDDGILDDSVLAARAGKEASSLETWIRNTRGIETLPGFHSWMYDTHICYSVRRQDMFGVNVDRSGSY